MQEEQDDGFFSFFWRSEKEKALEYDWALLERIDEEDKMMTEQQTTADVAALKFSQERLFQRYKIPKIDASIEALREVIDKLEKGATAAGEERVN